MAVPSDTRHEWQSLLTCVHTLPAGLICLFVVLDTNILLTRFWHAQKVLEVLAAAPRTLVEVVFVVPWVGQQPWGHSMGGQANTWRASCAQIMKKLLHAHHCHLSTHPAVLHSALLCDSTPRHCTSW